jgi:isochorismate synthase
MITLEALLNQEEKGFYLRLPLDSGGEEWIQPWSQSAHVLPFSAIRKSSSTLMGEQAYQLLVKRAIDTIRDGELGKVVTSRKVKLDFHREHALGLVEKWKSTFPNAYIFVLNHPDWGLWLGASPELLAYQGNGKFNTMALAGSKSSDDASEWTEKEKQEHLVVVNMIQQVLDEVGDQNRTVSPMHELVLNSVKHLKTTITSEVNLPFYQLVKRLHPTPALCGWPIDSAKEWIEQNEGYDRELYGGVLRVQRGEEEWAIVLLRCLKLEHDEAFAFVGGGIMKDSDPNNEWKETLWKLKSFTFAPDENFR